MKIPKTRREREIWQVCDQLVTEGALGHKVTGDAIRERLLEEGYSKGSPNEIYKYRKSWREARGVLDEDFSQNESQQLVLNDPLSRAVEAVRNEIRLEAEREIQQIKDDTIEQINKVQKALSEREQELKATLDKNQELSSENFELKSTNSTLQNELQDKKQQNLSLEQQLKFLEETRRMQEQQASQLLSELKVNHTQTLDNNNNNLLATEARYQKELHEYKELLETQRHKHIVELDNLKVDKTNLDIKLGQTEDKFARINKSFQEAQFIIRNLEAELENLKCEMKNQQTANKEQEIKLVATEVELKQIMQQYETQQGTQKELQISLQNKIQLVGQLEERTRQLQEIISEKARIAEPEI